GIATDRVENKREKVHFNLSKMANGLLYGSKKVLVGKEVQAEARRQWSHEEQECMERPLEVSVGRFDTWMSRNYGNQFRKSSSTSSLEQPFWGR
ncbi:unnamed protein product, partial [Polarella glacialis]